jgi:MYM-type Zinc finger with FCS sequence motif
MKVKFTNDEYDKSNALDRLTFECVNCGGDFKKEKRYYTSYIKGTHKGSIIYCSRECESKHKSKKIKLKCSFCNEEIERTKSEISKSKSGNVFCSKSCATTFNNKNKKHGTRRSKLEIMIEEKLKSKYEIDIIYNNKLAINSELDIYIPSLSLAFELNGIFHYEPIFGSKKLESVKNNDNRKFQACIENGIELCIINTTNLKNVDKCFKIIENIIDNKLRVVSS